jgi:hypothetical protein
MNRIEVTITTADDVLAEVLRRYWEQDENLKFPHRVNALAAQLGVRPHELNTLVREHSRAVVGDWRCTECESPKVVTSRSDYQQNFSTWSTASRYGGQMICNGCHAGARKRQTAAIQDEQVRKKELLHTRFKPRALPTDDPSLLTLRAVVHLLGIVNFAAHENLEWLIPIDRVEGILSPSTEYTNKVLSSLREAGLIEIHGGSDISAFEWIGDDPARFYSHKVFWTVGRNSIEAKNFIRRAEATLRAKHWPAHWLAELPDFVEELLLAEALQYLEFALNEHHMPFKPGDKTKLILLSTLDDFSLGQLYNLIWRQVKDAAAFLQRKNVSLQHAANIVPGGIQRAADYARSQGWSIKVFDRNFNVPLSAVSHALFNTALQLGPRLYSVSMGEIRHSASESIRQSDELFSSLRAALSEPRHSGRTAVHTILLRSRLKSPTFDGLAEMIEGVTMGEVDWEDFVSGAEAALDSALLPRYI